ncbi:hypothetical protein BVX99_03260 [bacterium F16]|nr:hypothetical protein BVX99_03260 [bacterium F16]
MDKNKLLLVQVAALGWDLVSGGAGDFDDLCFKPIDTVFPALTCPVQASLRTGVTPSEHGMTMNGIYNRDLRRPSFWEQSSGLVHGERIWSDFRKKGGTVGMLFWQQSLGEDVDVLLSPWPVHKHHGSLIDITHSKPAGLYDEVCKDVGRPFSLRHYWGPLAQTKASEWITRATASVMSKRCAPDFLMTYLPHLDYDLQRHPSGHPKCAAALADLWRYLNILMTAADTYGYDVMVVGDYSIGDSRCVVYPNKLLNKAGFMKTRTVEKMRYPDFYDSEAFAVVDHEIAHVFLKDPAVKSQVKELLLEYADEYAVWDDPEKIENGINHPNSGDLILVGHPGTWFAYPWWDESAEAPDYATHIDIHNKPGYDPCELFFGWNPFKVSTDCTQINGSHGVCSKDRQVAYAGTVDLGQEPANIIELSHAIKKTLTDL